MSWRDAVSQSEQPQEQPAGTWRDAVSNQPSQGLSEEEITAVRKSRAAEIPEISKTGFGALSENLGFMQAVAGLTAFDSGEFGKILQQADPNIGIVETPEGEHMAVNNETGKVVSLNKLGPSFMDALQVGGSVAAFAPASRGMSLFMQGGKGMLTQAAIESGQAAMGGEFNKEDVAIAAAAPIVIGKAFQGAKAAMKPIFAKTVAKKAASMADDLGVASQKSIPKDIAPESDIFRYLDPSKKQMIEMLEKGEIESTVATKFINAAGKMKNHKPSIAAQTQGYDEGVITMINSASKADRAQYRKMLTHVSRGLKNPELAQTNRPGDVIGDSLMRRWNDVKAINKQSGRDIGQAVKNDLSKVKVDLGDARQAFYGKLDDLNVTLNPETNRLVFKGSQIEIDSTAKKVLQIVHERINRASVINGKRAHELKEFLDTTVNWGKGREGGLAVKAENIVKDLRGGINNNLRDKSTAYAKANDTFSESIGALELMKKGVGGKFDPMSENANKLMGQMSRRLIGNPASRVQIMDSILGLEKVAAKHGKHFDDNILRQAIMVSELERRFPHTIAASSLKGEGTAIAETAVRAAAGQETGVGLALKAGKAAYEKGKGINDINAIKAMSELLN